MVGPPLGGPLGGALLPDAGIYLYSYNVLPFFTWVQRRMTDPIKSLRRLINMFKQPYLLGVTEGGIESVSQIKKTDPEIQDMDNYSDAHENIGKLYTIIAETIAAGGAPQPTNDLNTKSVNAIFEKKGVWPALREDPSLKDDMAYYAKLDLRTFPDTLGIEHIDEQKTAHVVPAVNRLPDDHDANTPNEVTTT